MMADVRIIASAAAIATTRALRHGAPAIENILDHLPADVVQQLLDDAEAALTAVAVTDDRGAAGSLSNRLADLLAEVFDATVLEARLEGAAAPVGIRTSGLLPVGLAERVATLLEEVGR